MVGGRTAGERPGKSLAAQVALLAQGWTRATAAHIAHCNGSRGWQACPSDPPMKGTNVWGSHGLLGSHAEDETGQGRPDWGQRLHTLQVLAHYAGKSQCPGLGDCMCVRKVPASSATMAKDY